jgi:excisionase family DNA binding protein
MKPNFLVFIKTRITVIMNEQKEILLQIRNLITELNSTLSKLNVENNRFTATTKGLPAGEYISISTAAGLLNVNLDTIADLIANNRIQHKKERDGVTWINKDSILQYRSHF